MTSWRFLASATLSGVAINLFGGCSSLPELSTALNPGTGVAAVVDRSVTSPPAGLPGAVVTDSSSGSQGGAGASQGPSSPSVSGQDTTPSGSRAQGLSGAQPPVIRNPSGRVYAAKVAPVNRPGASAAKPDDSADPDPATPPGSPSAQQATLDTLPAPAVDTEPDRQASGVLRDWSDAAVDEPASRADLWERLRQGMSMPDLDDGLVRRWERFYADKPEYMQRMTERASLYLYHIVDEVERRGMPMELALLPFIESAFNPNAVSTARAMGMWQFMPATGKQFDLKQNLFRDDRRAVQASTRAALDYLQSLHTMFGDWHLALASYNWGEGNVQRALERNRKAHKPLSYASLRMPAETRNYVPKLQAIENIVRDPARFGLSLPALQNHPFFLSVAVERDIDVSLVTRLADISADEFRALNPQLNKPVVLAAATPEILLPYDNARRFVRERDGYAGPLATWTAWVAPRTLHPAEAARLVGMDEGQIREVNRIPAQMMIRQGSTLLVTRKAHIEQDVTVKVADSASINLAPVRTERSRRYVRVGRQATTLAAMARLVGVTAADLAGWNGLKVDALLKPRQRLVVLAPSADSAKASKQRPKAAPATNKRKQQGLRR